MVVNKLYKYAKVVTYSVILGAFTFGCTDHFEDYNTNQHDATDYTMTLDNLKTGSFFAQLQRNVVLFNDGTNLDSDYQVYQGLTSDLYSGYIGPTGAWGTVPNTCTYVFVPGWTRSMFNTPFTNVMPTWKAIVDLAEEQGLPEIAAMATIVKVAAMHRVADTYGPIPYINFGSGSLQNTYDSLEDVYKKFFEELGSAIDELTVFNSGNPSAMIMKKFDYIYGGDVTKWVKFANTLRLRLAMRIVYANATLAQQEAEKSASHIMGLISNTNERASVKHAAINYYHPYVMIKDFNAGEARMSASMEAYMNGYQDPRRAAYFIPAASDGNYHGVRFGIKPTSNVWTNYVGALTSHLNFTNLTEIVWMTAAESYFLRAEGAVRGWNMGGTAQSFYEGGITASFDENGLASAAATYISNTSRTPAAFTDNTGGGHSMSAPSTITIGWVESATAELKLERIITQKWIAMYPDGPEGWAEFRRTTYPKLFPVAINDNTNINTTTQVRRIPYPDTENQRNPAGVASGVAKLGPDHGGTKLWWDKK
jgi:hypothetical protein